MISMSQTDAIERRLTEDMLLILCLDEIGCFRDDLTGFFAGERLGIVISTTEELSLEDKSSSKLSTPLRRGDRRRGRLEEEEVNNEE